MFKVGEIYNRQKEIHEPFGGQEQSGISTPQKHPYIFIFSGQKGQDFGYKDGWNKEGRFLYCGQGQVGDQKFILGNKAMRDHMKNRKKLFLFTHVQKGLWRFEGQMMCVDYHFEERPDRNRYLRQVIIFELKAINL